MLFCHLWSTVAQLVCIRLGIQRLLVQVSLSTEWERSGSVAQCLTPDRETVGLSLIGITGLCP